MSMKAAAVRFIVPTPDGSPCMVADGTVDPRGLGLCKLRIILGSRIPAPLNKTGKDLKVGLAGAKLANLGNNS